MPQDRQVWLAVLTFGSIAWVTVVAGVALPGVGLFLLTALPVPSWLQPDVIRLAMLAVALLLPAVLGAVSLLVADPSDRPRGGALVSTVARGYLLAPALAVVLFVLAIAGVVRKVASAIHRRTDAHVAMVVRPARYEALVADLERSLEPVLVTRRRPGSRVLTIPARLLAAIAEGGIRRLVPDQLIELVGPELTVSVYPADLALSGTTNAVARARAAITRDVRSVDAWFTTTTESQRVEDRLVALEEAGRPPTSSELDAIDRLLVGLTVSQEEWEVLYRRRLQLVTSGHVDVAAPGVPGVDGPGATAGKGRVGTSGRPDRSRRSPRPAIRAGTALGVAMVALVAVDIVLLLLRPVRPTADRALHGRR